MALCLTLALRILQQLRFDSSPPLLRGESTDFEGAHVAIKVWEAGRYLEVRSDNWIFASACAIRSRRASRWSP